MAFCAGERLQKAVGTHIFGLIDHGRQHDPGTADRLVEGTAVQFARGRLPIGGHYARIDRASRDERQTSPDAGGGTSKGATKPHTMSVNN